MALTGTTLALPCTATAQVLSVTSATGFAVGNFARLNDEFVYVNAIVGTDITVQRGRWGTLARAHGILSVIATGLPADFAPETRPYMYTYGAAGAITPKPGLHRLIAASAAAMTLAAPTVDQEGQIIRFIACAAQAYTITLDAGYFNATTNNKLTCGGAIGDTIDIIAIAGSWCVTLNKNFTVGT
jgi:hypothetical protein